MKCYSGVNWLETLAKKSGDGIVINNMKRQNRTYYDYMVYDKLREVNESQTRVGRSCRGKRERELRLRSGQKKARRHRAFTRELKTAY